MSQVQYLNTDLVIESPDDLSPIAEAFGEDVLVMYNGEWGKFYRAAFAIAGYFSDANETIESFCCLVENFAPQERAFWDSCFSKVFDIGYESGHSPQSYSSQLRSDTIKRIAEIGAALEITIYPLVNE